ncbi:hypothetical protein ACP4OV_027272 [Aristida adscensionis]
MSSKTALPSAVLALRLLALALLGASLALIAADKLTVDSGNGEVPLMYTFKDVYAYRYLLAVAVWLIGGTEGAALLLVSADVVFALLVATGAAAGLGFTCDVKRGVDRQGFDSDAERRDVERFFALAYAASGLMLGAAACMALMIMISTYALVK